MLDILENVDKLACVFLSIFGSYTGPPIGRLATFKVGSIPLARCSSSLLLPLDQQLSLRPVLSLETEVIGAFESCFPNC